MMIMIKAWYFISNYDGMHVFNADQRTIKREEFKKEKVANFGAWKVMNVIHFPFFPFISFRKPDFFQDLKKELSRRIWEYLGITCMNEERRENSCRD